MERNGRLPEQGRKRNTAQLDTRVEVHCLLFRLLTIIMKDQKSIVATLDIFCFPTHNTERIAQQQID